MTANPATHSTHREIALPMGAVFSRHTPPRFESDSNSEERSGFAPLDRIGTTMRIARDQAIFLDGYPAEHYFKVLDGTVRIFGILSDGRRQIIGFSSQSQFFGFSPGRHHRLSAEAVTDVTLVRYSRKHVESLLATTPTLARWALDVANDELQAAQRQLVVLGQRTAKERLVSFLLDLAHRSEFDGAFFHLAMSRRDIADYLGLTLETVSRIFSELKHGHYIELRGSHDVALRRPDDLAQLVE